MRPTHHRLIVSHYYHALVAMSLLPSGVQTFAALHVLTVQAKRHGPMINIIKLSEWLNKNVNEKLYPRLLYVCFIR
jgi:hypothetical protein